MDYKKTFLFLVILGGSLYLGNLFLSSFTLMGDSTKEHMTEYYSASKKTNSEPKKEQPPQEIKKEEIPEKEQPLPQPVMEALNEPVHNQQEDYNPPPEEPIDDGRGKLAVCISRMVNCQWTNIAFKYPSQEHPRSVERDNVEVECVTLGANCLNDNYQTITNEEANEIYNYYYTKFQEENKKKQTEQSQPVPEISNY